MSSAALTPLRSPPVGRRAKAAFDWRDRVTREMAFLLGFFCFLPYPAISAGNNSAIQIGTLITLAMLPPIFMTSWRRQPFYLFPLLLLPLCTSAVKIAVLQQSGLDSSLKTLISSAIPYLTLLPAVFYAPKWSLQIMTGIAVATVLHVLVGCWQEYVFLRGGEFPLLFLYVNPSFLSVAEQARDFVLYEQRPFGLFPEPSAMSSSLAPWVLIWIAQWAGLIRFVAKPSRVQRFWFGLAAMSGLALIITSRSGHAMVTLGAVLVFGLAWVAKARANPRNLLALVAVFGLVLPLAVWLTVLALSDRMGQATGMNQSWQDRSQSLVYGCKLWLEGGLSSIVFGIGIGRSAPALSNQFALDAVWSVLLTYLYETGMIGGAVIAWIGICLARVWKSCRFNLVFAAVALVWLVGITLTTSYGQLLPIWLTLGFMLVWPKVFAGASGSQSDARRGAALSSSGQQQLRQFSAERSLGMTPWANNGFD